MADYEIGVYTGVGFDRGVVRQNSSGTFTADSGLEFGTLTIGDDDGRFEDTPNDTNGEFDSLNNQQVAETSEFVNGQFKFIVPAGTSAYAASHYTITSVNGVETNFTAHSIRLESGEGTQLLREDLETGEIIPISALHLTSFSGVPEGMLPQPGDEIGYSAQPNDSSLGPDAYSYGPVDYDALQAPCFCTGSMIRTPQGEVAIETIEPGTQVLTAEGQAVTVKWVGKSEKSCAEMMSNPKIRPIRIRKGALGENIPSADLYVSPQHRMVVTSDLAASELSNGEILVPAKKLTFIDGIDQVEDIGEGVYYHHILLDRHHVVYANNAPTETLLLGEMTMTALSPEAIDEIRVLFPELRVRDRGNMAPARPIVERKKDIRMFLLGAQAA